MSFTDNWLETFENVLKSPTNFFESEDRRDGFGFPLKFAAVNLILTGIISAISTAVFGLNLGMEIGMSKYVFSAVSLVATPILGIIGLIVSSAILHIFVHLLGGSDDYKSTLSVVEYASAVQPIASLASAVPLIGGLIGTLASIYAFFIQIKGLEEFQQLSLLKSIAVLLLPSVIVIAIFAFLIITFGAVLLSSMPAPPA